MNIGVTHSMRTDVAAKSAVPLPAMASPFEVVLGNAIPSVTDAIPEMADSLAAPVMPSEPLADSNMCLTDDIPVAPSPTKIPTELTPSAAIRTTATLSCNPVLPSPIVEAGAEAKSGKVENSTADIDDIEGSEAQPAVLTFLPTALPLVTVATDILTRGKVSRPDTALSSIGETGAQPQRLELPNMTPAQNQVLVAGTQPAMATPIAASPQILPNAHLDLSQDIVWIDQLAREIVAFAATDGKLRFSLSPEGLGQLEVAIQTQKDGVDIRLQPSSESAARIFAVEQPRLLEELQQSGVRVTNSDLMSGQQPGSHRDQSQPQNTARQVPLRVSGQAQLQTAPTRQTRSHRFA